MDFFEIVTNEGPYPLELSEVKNYLRVDNSVDDGLIQGMIDAAIDFGEKYCNREFSIKTFDGYFSDPYCVYLKKSPVQSVTSVQYSKDGVFTAFTDFERVKRSSYDYIRMKSIPDIDIDVTYGFKVQFVAGYPETPPAGLKNAILAHIGFMYENRGDVIAEGGISLPPEVKQMYHRYRNIAGYA